MQLRAKLSTDFHQYDQSTRVSSLGAPTPRCRITKQYHQMLQSVLYMWLRCKDVSVCGLTLYQNILLKIYNIQKS